MDTHIVRPSIPLLLTVPAWVTAGIVWLSWRTDTHDTCSTTPLWSSGLLWVVPIFALSALFGARKLSRDKESPRWLRRAGPISAILALAYAVWFFARSFQLFPCGF